MSQSLTQERSPKPKKKKSTNQAPVNQETRKLISALNFTGKDLHYNRHGVVSREQYARIRPAMIWRAVIFGLVLLVSTAFGIAVVVMAFNGTIEQLFYARKGLLVVIGLGVLWVIFGLGMPIFSVYSILQAGRSMKALQSGEAKQWSGAIERHVSVSKRYDKNGKLQSTDKTYYLQFGSLKYMVPKKEFDLFKNGAAYRVYYVPYHTDYLSVEAIDPMFE